MANELTELTPHITAMRTKLSQTAEHERSLTHALSDELKRLDQQTLHSVRNLSAEHEARRAGILLELQALAASIGTFQPAHETGQPAALPRESGHPRASTVGDWRQATKSLSYHDELEFLLRNGHLNGDSSPQ